MRVHDPGNERPVAQDTRAQDDPRRPGLQEPLDLALGHDAPARLNRHAECCEPLHDGDVARDALEGQVHVDNVQPARPGFDRTMRGGQRIAAVGVDRDRPLRGEPGEPAAGQVDRGKHLEDHRGRA